MKVDKDGRRAPGAETLARLGRIAAHPKLRNAYYQLAFVPSTCFGTTAAIWAMCAEVRSFTRGPESLSRYVRALRRLSIGPVVQRASDIGMLHPLGYSVTNRGRDMVGEQKETYLLAPGRFDAAASALYRGNFDLLYAATSQVDEYHLRLLEADLARDWSVQPAL